YMEGSKFHNGQIVGPLETAPKVTTADDARELRKTKTFEVTPAPSDGSGVRLLTARFPAVDVPTKAPDRPTQILVVLQLNLTGSRGGEWDIDVSVQPTSPADFHYQLPRARLAAIDKAWLPVVSGLNPKVSYEIGDLASLQPRGGVMLQEMQRKQAAIRLDR